MCQVSVTVQAIIIWLVVHVTLGKCSRDVLCSSCSDCCLIVSALSCGVDGLSFSPTLAGETALFMASQNGLDTTVDLLLHANADPNVPTEVILSTSVYLHMCYRSVIYPYPVKESRVPRRNSYVACTV